MGSARSAGLRGLGKASTAAALGVGLVALAGCGGGADQPITTPAPTPTTTTTVPTTSVTTSTTSTATSTITSVTTAPSAGTPKGYNGALDLVATYFSRYNRANREGRIEVLDGLFSAACTDCLNLRSAVADRLNKGVKPNGDIFTPVDVEIETFKQDAKPITATVIAKVTRNPVKLLDSTGRLVESWEGKTFNFRLTLQYSESWVITSLRRVQ